MVTVELSQVQRGTRGFIRMRNEFSYRGCVRACVFEVLNLDESYFPISNK